MKLYSVTDGYIDFLRREHPHVYSNKELERTNTRKYIGVVLTVDDYDYFVPLSSPKPRDYITGSNGEVQIRKDTFTIFRIVVSGKLYGTIQFSNMIPVPETELIEYIPSKEKDAKYRDLVLGEMEYIRKNEARITSRARAVHYQKTNGYNAPVLQYCLDFASLEELYDTWKEWIRE